MLHGVGSKGIVQSKIYVAKITIKNTNYIYILCGVFLDIIQERREAKASEKKEPGPKSDKRTKGCSKLLWRAFQFAFRVYTFAGGHDDRADKLTRELANEIENDHHHQ